MDKSIKLAPGYRFNPIDQELISFYLKPKVLGQKLPSNVVEEKQLYGPDANPWQVFDQNHEWILSEVSPGKFENITYVFVNLTKKAAAERKTKGVREQYIKKAGCGTWDGQTKRTDIWDFNGYLIGEKRLLVFEINEVCGLDLSKVGYWKMHEYHLFGVNEGLVNSSNTVLCKITLDHSKNPPIKSRPSSKPWKKNTNVDSGNGDGNQGVSESHGGAALTTQTRRDDLVVLDSDETCYGAEWMNSNYDEENILRTASSPSEVVDTGNMKPVSSDYCQPAKHDTDYQQIKKKVGDSDQALIYEEATQNNNEDSPWTEFSSGCNEDFFSRSWSQIYANSMESCRKRKFFEPQEHWSGNEGSSTYDQRKKLQSDKRNAGEYTREGTSKEKEMYALNDLEISVRKETRSEKRKKGDDKVSFETESLLKSIILCASLTFQIDRGFAIFVHIFKGILYVV